MLEAAAAAVGGLYKGVKLTHCWQMSKMLFPPLFGPIWFCERKKDTHVYTTHIKVNAVLSKKREVYRVLLEVLISIYVALLFVPDMLSE